MNLTALLEERGLDLDVHAPVSELVDQEVRERVLALHTSVELIESALVEAVGELDARGVPRLDGEVSTARWLVNRAPLSRQQANTLVTNSRRIRRHDVVREAVQSGELPVAKACLLDGVHNERSAPFFARDLAELMEIAATLTVDDFKTALNVWVAHADPDGSRPDNPDRNTITLSVIGDRGLLRGDLDAETTAILAEQLTNVADELFRNAPQEDRAGRSAANWRYDAFVELIHRSAAGDPATGRPAKPLITVVVEWDKIADSAGAVVTLPTGQSVHASLIRRLSCDATVARVVVAGDSQVLDAGRAHRNPSESQARAVIARDRCCAIEGCDEPPSRCQIHHVWHWGDGGPTDLVNLALICRRHHRMIHDEDRELGRRPRGQWAIGPPGSAREAAA